MPPQPLARLKTGAAFFTPASNSASMPGLTSICAISVIIGCLRQNVGGIMSSRERGASGGRRPNSERAHAPQRPIAHAAGGESDEHCKPGAAVGVLERHVLGVHTEETR